MRSRTTGAMVVLAAMVTALGCRSTEADKQSIRESVTTAMKAGIEGHDLEAYLSVWADDAVLVKARSEEKGPYEVTLDREAIAETRALLFGLPVPPGTTVSFEDVQVDVDGDRATLRMRSSVSGPNVRETVAEVYELRRGANGWRITKNRFWPLSTLQGNALIEFTAEEWAKRDARVAELKERGDDRRLVGALLDAQRFTDAHETAQRLCVDGLADPRGWALCAFAALAAGDAEAAKKDYRKALKLEPSFRKWVPSSVLNDAPDGD